MRKGGGTNKLVARDKKSVSLASRQCNIYMYRFLLCAPKSQYMTGCRIDERSISAGWVTWPLQKLRLSRPSGKIFFSFFSFRMLLFTFSPNTPARASNEPWEKKIVGPLAYGQVRKPVLARYRPTSYKLLCNKASLNVILLWNIIIPFWNGLTS